MALAAANLQAAAPWPQDPFPGLRPFESDEWQIFFGRESMVDDVIDRMAQQPLVFIHGASGSGKSSLVRAGVLPKLDFQHLRHGAAWLTCTMRPSGGPLFNLAQELAKLEGRAGDMRHIGEIVRAFNRRGATLASVVGGLAGTAGKRVCILVDQFEELFRFERETSREEAELFVSLLTGTLELPHDHPEADRRDDRGDRAAAADVHVIITMRSEFLGECARYDGLAEAFNCTQYLVPRMTREALVRAIRRPAELYGGEVTLELTDRLIADARGREDELPLIQHGLMQMWHEAKAASRSGRILLDADRLTITGGLAALLSDHADQVMAGVVVDLDEAIAADNARAGVKPPSRLWILLGNRGLAARYQPPPTAAMIVQRLFRALTDINAEGRAIRRPQRFHDLVILCGTTPDRLRRVLDAFRSPRVSFLVPYAPAEIEDDTRIDIGHEALIRCWNRIADPRNGWLKLEFEDGLVWRSLLIQAIAFKDDRRQLLSSATADQRTVWLAGKSPLWSERYGGNWTSVAELVLTSERRGTRGRRFWRIGTLLVAWLGILFALILSNDYLKNVKFLGSELVSLLLGVASSVIGLWICVLLGLVAFDYWRQFSDWLRRRGTPPPIVRGLGIVLIGLGVLLILRLVSLPFLDDTAILIAVVAIVVAAALLAAKKMSQRSARGKTPDPALEHAEYQGASIEKT